MKATYLLAAVLLAMTGCAGEDDTTGSSEPTDPTTTPVSTSEVAALPDGPIPPGRYRHTVVVDCEGVEDDPIACPAGVETPPPLGIDVTVPAGWSGANDFHLVESAAGTEGPKGAALVLGWTTYAVGLNSDPCLSTSHEVPDVKVGPSVDDFVDAVQANKRLDVSAPEDVTLGGYSGRFFTLRGPADISSCDNWRPWDPGFYVQGNNNLWEVWAMDVDGQRALVVTQHFPATPAKVVRQLRAMAESVSFDPTVAPPG